VLFDALAIDPVKGSTPPTVVEGRAANAPNEIMVGTRTLEDMHRRVGDEINVSTGGRPARLRVVGRGVLPEFAGSARLGEGAAMTYDGARRIIGNQAVADVILVRARPGPRARLLASSRTRIGNVYRPRSRPTS
jgi:hypothetical protein